MGFLNCLVFFMCFVVSTVEEDFVVEVVHPVIKAVTWVLSCRCRCRVGQKAVVI